MDELAMTGKGVSAIGRVQRGWGGLKQGTARGDLSCKGADAFGGFPRRRLVGVRRQCPGTYSSAGWVSRRRGESHLCHPMWVVRTWTLGLQAGPTGRAVPGKVPLVALGTPARRVAGLGGPAGLAVAGIVALGTDGPPAGLGRQDRRGRHHQDGHGQDENEQLVHRSSLSPVVVACCCHGLDKAPEPCMAEWKGGALRFGLVQAPVRSGASLRADAGCYRNTRTGVSGSSISWLPVHYNPSCTKIGMRIERSFGRPGRGAS